MNRTDVELLFATYREPVYRFLRRSLHDGPAAEDLTQEAFLRALGGSWQAGGHARAWIFQIARNLARDHLRARARRPMVTPLTGLEGNGAADPASALAFDAALASLDVDDRKVFLLKEAHVWKVTTTGVKYEDGRQTFDLDWTRYAAATGSVPVASRTQRLTLAQGEVYTVDLLHNTSSECRTASIVLEIEAAVREDPALADTVLRYDVWLVRRDASGKKETRQFVLTGKQGAAVPFAFAPLVGEVPKLQTNQYDFSVQTHVSGELRGRIGSNGRLSLELTTRRQDRLHQPALDPSASSGLGAGRKVLEVGEGETVEIELPARSGYSAHYASAADAARGAGTSTRVGAGQGRRHPPCPRSHSRTGGSSSASAPTSPTSACRSSSGPRGSSKTEVREVTEATEAFTTEPRRRNGDTNGEDPIVQEFAAQCEERGVSRTRHWTGRTQPRVSRAALTAFAPRTRRTQRQTKKLCAHGALCGVYVEPVSITVLAFGNRDRRSPSRTKPGSPSK